MKKKYLVLIVLLLFTKTIIFTQEESSLGKIGLGYQMVLVENSESNDWVVGHSFKLIVRGYLFDLNENIGFGPLFSVRFSFLNELDWIDPYNGEVKKITNANYITDVGAIIGVGLHGNIFGPFDFGIGLGVGLNFNTAEVEKMEHWLWGKYTLNSNVFNLGVAANAGVMINIARFGIELGVDFSYSFLRSDQYTQKYDYGELGFSQGNNGVVEINTVNSDISFIRICPYIVFVIKI